MNDLMKVIEGKLIEAMNPNKDKIKKPHNRLWVALIAFNLIFFPLDIVTGATVGFITRWYYGIFVFFAGFGTMIVHEALYSNPFAKGWQKAISVAGFFTSVGITLCIGVVAIVINILFTGYDKELVGAIMAGAAFAVLFFHGTLIAIYYFIDAGIVARQRAMSTLADHERLQSTFTQAEQIVDQMNNIKKRLEAQAQQGNGLMMGAALSNMTGEDWNIIKQNGHKDPKETVTVPNSQGRE